MERHVIYDTEFTAWKGSQERGWSEPWEERELLQIAAVKVEIDESGCRIIESFNEFIRPVINPQLSDYIIHLTGITQELIDQNAIDLFSALKAFGHFCGDGRYLTASWGEDVEILKLNTALQNITMPTGLRRHVNLTPILHTVSDFNFQTYGGDLHKIVGVEVSGIVHNALHDVNSVAATLNFLLQNHFIHFDELTEKIRQGTCEH